MSRRLPDGTLWPTVAETADLEHLLRYGESTREQLLQAAGVLAAYRHLVAHLGPTDSIILQLRMLRRAEREFTKERSDGT